MSPKLFITLIFINIVFISGLFAQKWGDISKEDIKMTSLPEDPEADAVILLDKGTIDVTTNFELVFRKHKRIKILTERGKKYADVTISYWKDDHVGEIEAVTYLSNGKKVKLERNQIFEKIGDLGSQKVFAFPGVEVGAVLEYRYERISEHLHFLRPWFFQDEEFTRVSSLHVFLPFGFNYNTFFSNFPGITEPKTNQIFRPDNPNKRVYEFSWRVENIPGIKSEPYMPNLEDNYARVYFQLVSFKNEYTHYEFIKSWDDVAKTAREFYEPFINQDSGLKDFVDQKLAGVTNRNERIKILYDYVREQIETTNYRGVFSDLLKKPADILKNKSGSAVEKNLLLINLLNQAGLDARLMLISTRSNGKFQPSWAQIRQFDHTLAAIPSTSKLVLLDAGDRYCPFGMLPPDDLSSQGLLVEKEKGEVVRIPPSTFINQSLAKTQATLTEEGDLLCRTTLQYEDYEARKIRSKLSDESKEKFVKAILENRFETVTLDSFRITGENEVGSPLKITLNFRLANYAQTTGEMYYLNLALLHRLQTNPFKHEKRSFPVEYDYCEASKEEVEINLPTGLLLTEMPKLTRFTLPFMTFNTSCEVTGQQIRFTRDFRLKQILFAPTAYAGLRKSYEDMVSSDQTQIVLSRQPGGEAQSK